MSSGHSKCTLPAQSGWLTHMAKHVEPRLYSVHTRAQRFTANPADSNSSEYMDNPHVYTAGAYRFPMNMRSRMPCGGPWVISRCRPAGTSFHLASASDPRRYWNAISRLGITGW